MGLRDVFAKMGFCESSEERAGKPGCIEKLIAKSAPATAQEESRIRAVLEETSGRALAYLAGNNVTVCLDPRLAAFDRDDSKVMAMFYDQGDRKILSLYDNGADLKQQAWYFKSMSEQVGRSLTALKQHGSWLFKAFAQQKLVVCTAQYSTASSYMARSWSPASEQRGLLSANPEMKTPPASSARSSTAPAQNPALS